MGRDDLVPPERMLEIVRDLGYTGTELGPPGYLGADAREVAAALEPYGLELAGAFVPLRIADEDAFLDELALLDATIDDPRRNRVLRPGRARRRRERDEARGSRAAGRSP